MKSLLAAFLMFGVALGAHAADWSYSTKHDPFFNKEDRTAVLRASDIALGHLTIFNDSKTTRFVLVSGGEFKCFPKCLIFAKFDDEEPEAFAATSTSIVAAALSITEYERFIRKVKAAKSVTFRIPQHGAGRDITFVLDTPFDEAKWDDARKLGALRKQCENNAVTENFSDCMRRIGGQQ